MEYIRFLHVRHFDNHPKQNRFKSLAFRNSTGGGASVVQRACIDATNITICDHIRRYYSPAIAGEPPIFWIFDESILTAGHRLEQERSDTGDDCHYNIHGVSDAHYKKILKSKRLEDFLICDGAQARQLVRGDLPPPATQS